MAANELDRSHWFALQIRSRQEDFVASVLKHKGYVVFLPAVCRPEGEFEEHKPLFPGYLFVHFDPWSRYSPGGAVVTTESVIRIVGAGRHPLPIPTAEIDSIMAVVASGLNPHPVPYGNIGDTVYIADGPLRGVRGAIQRIKNRQKLIVSISLLQRSVAVEFDIADVNLQGAATGRSS